MERYGSSNDLLDRLGTAIATARAASIPVIYVMVRFRDGLPEISPRNKGFSTIKQNLNMSGGFSETNPASEIHPAIAPPPGDIVVTKKRVSAFIGSDLDVVLRSLNIDTLILSGIATSGVVLSTLRYAADMDYRLNVLSDCCADSDAEVHRVLLEKVFPRQATVLTVAEWTALTTQAL